jgi:hypothetical protein
MPDTLEEKVDFILRRLDEPIAAPRFLNLADAARYAGLCERSILRLIAARKLTPLRVNRRVLIDKRELDALILSSK